MIRASVLLASFAALDKAAVADTGGFGLRFITGIGLCDAPPEPSGGDIQFCRVKPSR